MFPTYREIEAPLVEEIRRRGGRTLPRDKDSRGLTIYDALAARFHLSAADLGVSIMENGRPRSKWENMVRYARRSLKDQGVIADSPHGIWALSKA